MSTQKIEAPFTAEQVKNLNAYQESGRFHEFTCGNDHDGSRILVATYLGWHCPSCPYTQDWAHAFMAEPLPPAWSFPSAESEG